MKATVITDASFCNKSNAAGWAAWIRIDGAVPIKAYGAFKGYIARSDIAEMKAAINGIYLARKHGATSILLQTDCLVVVHMANGQCGPKGKSRWHRAMKAAGLTKDGITARHVKGHTTTADARSHVNRWCDENARREMARVRPRVRPASSGHACEGVAL